MKIYCWVRKLHRKRPEMKTRLSIRKREIKRVEKLIQENHLELNATDKIEDISVGGRQRVEIPGRCYTEM